MSVPKFWAEEVDDETTELFVGEKSVATLTHEEHGWSGMNGALKMFKAIAKAVGAEFEQR